MQKSSYGLSTEVFAHKTGKATFAVYANLRKPSDDLFCRVVADDSKFRLDINDFAVNGKGNSKHAIYNLDIVDMLELYDLGKAAVIFGREYKMPPKSKIVGSMEDKGTCPAYRCNITRDPKMNNPWIIQIINGRAKPKRMENGACMEESGSFQKTTEGKIFMTDAKFLEMINNMHEKWREVGLVYAMQSIGNFEKVYENYQKGSYKENLTPNTSDPNEGNPFTGSSQAESEPNREGLFEDIPETSIPKPKPEPKPAPAPEKTACKEYTVTAIITSDFTAVGGVYMAEIVVNGKKYSILFKEITPKLKEVRETGAPVQMVIQEKYKNNKRMFLCKSVS